MKSILLVCDLEHIKDFFYGHLTEKFSIFHSYTLHLNDSIAVQNSYDFIFIDLKLLNQFSTSNKKKTYYNLIAPFRNRYPLSIIVIMSDSSKSRDAVLAIKSGADNFLNYPLSTDEIFFVLENEQQFQQYETELSLLKDIYNKEESFYTLTTKSPKMAEVLKQINIVATTKSTVLLTGETGTGKGVLSKIIHQRSNRKRKKYVPVHCGAIPSTLIESELFGHERGAFTGAERRKLGKFELAHEGTIFLDEIGTVSPQVQISLLQILQEKSFARVGGEENINIDVKVIAATNADLNGLTKEGKFRQDLFYRLNVFPIHIPPLRERPEDIPLFVNNFITKFNIEHQKNIRGIANNVLRSLINYSWPGNIRELENIIERAYILESSDILTSTSFPPDILKNGNIKATIPLPDKLPLSDARKLAVDLFEKSYLENLLSNNLGKINQSASEAGITTRQLHKLLIKHCIDKSKYKNQNLKN